jgi:hypothetical protein
LKFQIYLFKNKIKIGAKGIENMFMIVLLKKKSFENT